MSVEFVNEHGDSYPINGYGISMYFTLLERYGWKPLGTRKPPGFGLFRRWPGSYHTNDGQLVTAKDARNMSEAVKRALEDTQLEDHAAELVKGITERATSGVSPALAQAFQLVFSKDAFREFGEFCAKGPFRVT